MSSAMLLLHLPQVLDAVIDQGNEASGDEHAEKLLRRAMESPGG